MPSPPRRRASRLTGQTLTHSLQLMHSASLTTATSDTLHVDRAHLVARLAVGARVGVAPDLEDRDARDGAEERTHRAQVLAEEAVVDDRADDADAEDGQADGELGEQLRRGQVHPRDPRVVGPEDERGRLPAPDREEDQRRRTSGIARAGRAPSEPAAACRRRSSVRACLQTPVSRQAGRCSHRTRGGTPVRWPVRPPAG